MTILTKLAKAVYRKLVPVVVRDSQFVTRLKLFFLGHDWVYYSDYYQHNVEGPAVRSASKIADTIMLLVALRQQYQLVLVEDRDLDILDVAYPARGRRAFSIVRISHGASRRKTNNNERGCATGSHGYL